MDTGCVSLCPFVCFTFRRGVGVLVLGRDRGRISGGPLGQLASGCGHAWQVDLLDLCWPGGALQGMGAGTLGLKIYDRWCW